MLAQGRGKIINMASMATLLVPHPQKQIAYNASKAAVVKITQVRCPPSAATCVQSVARRSAVPTRICLVSVDPAMYLSFSEMACPRRPLARSGRTVACE